jgi:hypothetical protein
MEEVHPFRLGRHAFGLAGWPLREPDLNDRASSETDWASNCAPATASAS